MISPEKLLLRQIEEALDRINLATVQTFMPDEQYRAMVDLYHACRQLIIAREAG